MKVCLMSDINNPHTLKWCMELERMGVSYYVISLTSPQEKYPIRGRVFSLKQESVDEKRSIQKITYLFKLKEIRETLNKHPVDVIHAHFASSYGFLAALSKRREKLIMTLWGSDILIFPKKTIVHRKIIEYTLKKSDKIIATSNFLSEEALRYTGKTIEIIPFYIDENIFYFKNRIIKKAKNHFITAKSLKPIYGFDILLPSFNKFVKEIDQEAHLFIAGEGPLRDEIEDYIKKEGLSKNITLLGHLSFDDLSFYYRKADIAIYPSKSESFGVSALEAQMIGIPVIASNIPAFRETVLLKENLFEEGSSEALFDKMVDVSSNYPALDVLKSVSDSINTKYSWQEVHDKNKNIYLEIKEEII